MTQICIQFNVKDSYNKVDRIRSKGSEESITIRISKGAEKRGNIETKPAQVFTVWLLMNYSSSLHLLDMLLSLMELLSHISPFPQSLYTKTSYTKKNIDY